MKNYIILIPVLLLLSACSFYSADVEATPSFDIQQKYINKVPGSFALYIDGDAYREDFTFSKTKCFDKTYPVDAGNVFKLSTYKTFMPLIHDIQLVEQPLDRQGLAERGLKAQIVVKAEDIQAILREVPGFWETTVDMRVDMLASIKVTPRHGASYERTFPSKAQIQADGKSCIGVAYKLMELTEGVTKDLMTTLGEAVANSHQLREM